MAVVIQFRVCAECAGINLKDVTHLYSATTNPNGWGTPNPTFVSVIPYTVAITRPKQTVVALTVDMHAGPPVINADEEYVQTVTAGDLNIDVIESGIWTFVWSAGDQGGVMGGVPQGNTIKTLLFGDIKRQIDARMLAALKAPCDEAEIAYARMLVLRLRTCI